MKEKITPKINGRLSPEEELANLAKGWLLSKEPELLKRYHELCNKMREEGVLPRELLQELPNL